MTVVTLTMYLYLKAGSIPWMHTEYYTSVSACKDRASDLYASIDSGLEGMVRAGKVKLTTECKKVVKW